MIWMDVDAALSEVPVNLIALTDDTDFKTREVAIVYNQAGMDLVWNFVTTAGAVTQTAVTPTTAGVHDWVHQGDGMYTLEIPASAGTINNDTEGFGYFTGIATGVLHWRGPTIGFRAAGLNNLIVDDAFSATRGLAGTALPAAAADAAGGLPISDLGGFAVDGTALEATLGTPTDTDVSTDNANIQSSIDVALEALILQSTTIATLASQVSFTLTAGSADDAAYEAATIVVIDATTGTQKAFGSISAYTGASKTVALAQDPGVFTMAVGDIVHVLTSDAFAILDRRLTGSTHNVADSLARRVRDLQEFGTYEGGAVTLDTVNGTGGTTDFESGTIFNAVDTIADVNTLLTSRGLSIVRVIPGSSFTLAASQNSQAFFGTGWTLALGGQDIGGTLFKGAAISGIGTGSSQIKLEDCQLNGATLHPFEAKRCSIGGTLVLQGTTPTDSDYFLHQCFSEIAGTATPVIDFGALETDTNLNMRDYSGGIEVQNMGQAGVDTMSLEGDGQLIINANCTGGTIAIRGNFTVTDNSGGAVTILDDARFDVTQVEDAVWDAPLTPSSHNDVNSAGKKLRQIPATIVREDTAQAGTANTITLDAAASAVDGAYDPAGIFISSGTGTGQTRAIIEYDGTTKIAVVDRNWKMTPDATSVFVIIGFPGREHVNEGLAQAGGANTITLNVLASATNDAYVGQIVFIRSGTGEDQSGTVIAYNGTTKIATVHRNWGVVPDTTSGYVMLPASPVELTANAIDNILDEALSGHTTAGTLGKAVTDIEANQGTPVVTISDDLAAVQGTADDIETKIDAQDAVLTLPGQVTPSQTPTPREAQAHLYKADVNKSDQNSGTRRFYANDGTTVDQKQTASDSGSVITTTKKVAGP